MPLRRNFSNNTRDSDGSRSRGISGTSGELVMNKTQTSHSSNSSLRQHKHTVADKVRQVHNAKYQTPESSRQGDVCEPENENSNTLSPYHSRVVNRRSLSFAREPRSPSWNKANFDSSAMSSNQSKSANDLPTSDSESLESER